MIWPRIKKILQYSYHGMPFRRRTLLVHREVDDMTAVFATELNLRNACVAFHDDAQSLHRSQITADLTSPIVMHGFNERALGYVRLTSVRAIGVHERNALKLCSRAPLGLGIPISHPSSIYHQLYHAVPAWLYLRSHLERAGLSSDAPASAFVPLVFGSAALGRGKPAAPRRWHGWELSLRALTRSSAAEIAAATAKLLRSSCTCFETFAATAAPFSPGARASSAFFGAFRAAALHNAMLDGSSSSSSGSGSSSGVGGSGSNAGGGRELLLVSRRSERRALSNEAVVWAALQRFGRVRRVAFEEMSLNEQMRLVSTAAALIAVHGQALAWLPFLPWEAQPVGVVEVTLASRRGVVNECYERWSKALGIRYWRIAGTLAGGCNGGVSSRDNEAVRAQKMLSCNVTVDVLAVVGDVTRAFELPAG